MERGPLGDGTRLTMASTVVVPFRQEDPGVLERTLGIAARHPSVRRVVAVGYDRQSIDEVAPAVARVGRTDDTPIDVLPQRRIGTARPGKGDGMLTGFEAALADPHTERVHVYDADIRTFSTAWIDRAEIALDEGFDVARHWFDRAATDAQITWHVTRPLLSMLWPRSILPDVEQPLGGELAMTRAAAEALVADPTVRRRSDWGIDTALTIAIAASGLRLAEVFVPEGKLHGLYGSLADLRTMLTECFEAIVDLRGTPVPDASGRTHRVEPAGPPAASVTTKVAFDVESTLPLLGDGWTPEERRLAASLPPDLAAGFEAMTAFPTWSFLDDEAWMAFLAHRLDHHRPGDPVDASLLFRGWAARVLRHATGPALGGYDEAMHSLRRTVARFRERARTA